MELSVVKYNKTEPIKEFTCLHGIAKFLAGSRISLDEAFNGVVNIVVDAWQYPKLTCARIIFDGKEFRTDNFRLTKWRQSSDIRLNGERKGSLEVYYLKEKPGIDEGPFLKEKRILIESIAQQLTNFIEHKQAEESIKLAYEEVKQIFEAAADGMWIIDKEFNVLQINKVMSKLSGMSIDEAKGKKCYEIFNDNRCKSDRCPLVGIFNGNKRIECEIEKKRADGVIIPFIVTAVPYRRFDGEVIGIIEDFKDITERKQSESTLRESKAFAENLIASMKDGFSVLDNQGVNLNVNAALCHMTGFTRDELIGVGPPHPYWPEEALEEIQKTFHKTLKGEFEDFELIFKRKDGERFPVIVSPSWLKDKEGNVISYFATIKDITERKQAEERYRTIIQSTLDGFFLSDLQGSILDVNDAFCQMLGYSREEILSMTVCDFDLEFMEAPETLRQRILEGKEAGGVLSVIQHKCKDGRIIDVSVSVKYLNIGPGFFFCFHRDITERKKTEEKLRQYREHLEELVEKRTAELEEQIRRRIEFTRALVHELKTPLTAVISSGDILLENLRDEIQLRLARNITTSARNLDKRIGELLDLARGEVGMLRIRRYQINPLRLVRKVANQMRPEAVKRGQNLVMDTPNSLPLVYADGGRLSQVLQNLIGNAMKFNRRGGTVFIAVKEEDGCIVFQIRDEGAGINQEDQHRIFDPYFRHESDREHLSGLGLGLPLSQKIVELHGGRIWLASQQGRGNTFNFSIPLTSVG